MLLCPNDHVACVAEVDPAFRGDVLTGLSPQSQCRAAKGCGMGKPLIRTAIWTGPMRDTALPLDLTPEAECQYELR
jgi:hypothetical protein